MDVAHASGDEYNETLNDEQEAKPMLRSVPQRQASV
jgi:hypothetical protein